MELTDRSALLPVASSYSSASPRGAAARRRILQGAREVLGAEGLAACSLSAVAKAGGCSKAKVLYHFGSRDGLLAALGLELKTFFVDQIWEAAATSFRPRAGGTERALRAAMDELFRAEHRAMLRADCELIGLGQRYEEVGGDLASTLDELVAKIAALGATLGTGLDTPELEARARAMITAIYGHIELWLCSGGGDPVAYREGAVRAARAIAVEGIEGI